jgi:hypothetical protein
MVSRVCLLLGVFTIITAFAAEAPAQEKRLKKTDLPGAVQKTADEVSKGATVRGYSSEVERGQLQYEVELTVGNHSKDVTIASDGTVLEVEEQVELATLPAPVQEGIRKRAGTGKVTRVESISKHGVLTAYEAQVRTGDKNVEVQVGPNGQALNHNE